MDVVDLIPGMMSLQVSNRNGCRVTRRADDNARLQMRKAAVKLTAMTADVPGHWRKESAARDWLQYKAMLP